jgi:hypothetical protein
MMKIQGSKTLVTVVKQKEQSSLVQFVTDEVLTRKYVPTKEIVNGFVPDEVLEQAIPYGYPFEEITLIFNNQKFVNEMHNVGVWTAEDALKNQQKVWAALCATFAENLPIILETSKKELNRSKK